MVHRVPQEQAEPQEQVAPPEQAAPPEHPEHPDILVTNIAMSIQDLWISDPFLPQ
jgi:hypothetical protein